MICRGGQATQNLHVTAWACQNLLMGNSIHANPVIWVVRFVQIYDLGDLNCKLLDYQLGNDSTKRL